MVGWIIGVLRALAAFGGSCVVGFGYYVQVCLGLRRRTVRQRLL